jgi:hypothetical protein
LLAKSQRNDLPQPEAATIVTTLRVRLIRNLGVLLAVIWASPYTLLGLCLGFALQGQRQFVDGVVEFHGPRIARFLNRLPVAALAITFGHVVLAQTAAGLEITRKHERVHVRQYSLWGPLMGPAYLLCSAYLWLRGKDAYRDNPFEREAFRLGE